MQINTFSRLRYFDARIAAALAKCLKKENYFLRQESTRIGQVISIFVGLFQAFRYTVVERGRKNKTERRALLSERL